MVSRGKEILFPSVKNLSKTTSGQMETPVENSIRQKLTQKLEPSYLEVINESYMHSVPKGSESHFKVVVVSEKFESLPLIKRHRLVNEILKSELENDVHALSIMAKTPKQWEESDKDIGKSPPCRGGAGL